VTGKINSGGFTNGLGQHKTGLALRGWRPLLATVLFVACSSSPKAPEPARGDAGAKCEACWVPCRTADNEKAVRFCVHECLLICQNEEVGR
jgi:hypothetical protein